ncbi:hypothetical protein RhiirC2_803576 [Rhizophagus irregularis]|uniref:Uncharacterized protein n=1 Tax=Rhizophagus irregularis TaxID=588596 RepID=A0A2N1LFT5_9GLOM|nr:hypothetical protein RhiirC2_803576 [Rhizophagus irregularis]
MKENFLYWTSENKEIDELIRYTQLNASQTCDYLEWIPWNWDDGAQEWARAGPMTVALKRLDSSENFEFFH